MRLKLIVTGGGTGGHVYPALEVARFAASRGSDILYLGSVRGQEAGACRKADIPFRGFPSEPVYSVRTVRGWRALANLLRSMFQARKVLRQVQPDAVFSTGGYSSAPIVRAARSLQIPYVLHEQNAAPGRSNLMAAPHAKAIATTFHAAGTWFEGLRVERTGLPVRSELRERAIERKLHLDAYPLRVLVVGGSQGAAAVNEAALAVAARITRDLHWLHITGKAHFETIFPTYEKLGVGGIYQVKAFLEGPEMADAYAEASLVVSRSGAGTLSELAAFGLPSVLIPYPHAHADHQTENAREFESMGAAVLIPQETLQPANLEQALLKWIDVSAARDSARSALETWDVPDSVERILKLVEA